MPIDQSWLNQACFMINLFVEAEMGCVRPCYSLSVACRPTSTLLRNLLKIQNLKHQARHTKLESVNTFCLKWLPKLSPVFQFLTQPNSYPESLVKRNYVVAFCLPFLLASLQEATQHQLVPLLAMLTLSLG